MRKVALVLLLAVSIVVLPKIVFASFNFGDVALETRLEVSKDNATWVNYLADSNSGNQTLTVSPGDTLYFRLKTWDTGLTPATNVRYGASFTNPSYIDSLDPFHIGTNDDSDGDGHPYTLTGTPDMTAGTFQFTLDNVASSSTETTNDESGAMVAGIDARTPDQTVFLVTVQITGIVELSNASWLNNLSPKAYADSQATTQVRILVSNPALVSTPAVTASTPATANEPFYGK
jgi:hypothetical protein